MADTQPFKFELEDIDRETNEEMTQPATENDED